MNKKALFFHCWILKMRVIFLWGISLLPFETMPQFLNQKLKKITSASFHAAYSYIQRQICAHVCINYWFIYMFGRMLQLNFDECKLLFIMNNNWQESLQEPEVDLVFHFTTRYQYSAEPPTLHIHLTFPQSWPPK